MSSYAIKLPKAAVIKRLQAKLLELKKKKEEDEKIQKKIEEARKGRKKRIERFIDSNRLRVSSGSIYHNYNKKLISIVFEVPNLNVWNKMVEEPEKAPSRQELNCFGKSIIEEDIKEVEKIVRLLNMSEDETISTSAQKSFMKFL